MTMTMTIRGKRGSVAHSRAGREEDECVEIHVSR